MIYQPLTIRMKQSHSYVEHGSLHGVEKGTIIHVSVSDNGEMNQHTAAILIRQGLAEIVSEKEAA